jgi:flagellar biosynthetic protein FlhB
MPPSAESKTEKPTPRRRERARKEGDVAQSSEVNNVLVLLAAVGALSVSGGAIFQGLVEQMTGRLGALGAARVTETGAVDLLRQSVRAVVAAGVPVMVSTAVVGLICSVAQTGILFVPRKLAPNLSAMDPVKGFKNMISLAALQRLGVALGKLAIVGVVAYYLVRSRLDWLPALVGKSVWGILLVTRSLCMSLMIRVLLALLVVALLDYAYQRWRHEKKLMMSKGELKEEMKREDGDPEIRARRSHMRRSLVHRMMTAIPQADVVVANPTHYAVALKWDEEKMSAPQVVAKGADYMAERIKEVARQNGVPVLERKPLARALYEAVEVGMEIPPKLYFAVAEVLAFVLKKRKAG